MESPLETSDDIILGTAHCDGILCMFMENPFTNIKSAVVWNPMTKEHKRIPIAGRKGSWEAFGFGYDSVIDDYKLIFIRGSFPDEFVLPHRWRNIHGKSQQWRDIDGLRLKAGGWNPAPKNVPYGFAIFNCNRMATAVNGCLYWIAANQDESRGWICGVILCYDLERDQTLREETSLCGEGIFYEDSKSVQVGFCSNYCVLGVLGNSLCLVRTYDGLHSDLFVMVENEGTKTKHWINLVSIHKIGPELHSFNVVNPICVTRNGHVLTNEKSETGLFLFSQDEPVKKIAIHGLPKGYKSFYFLVIPYVESLVSPNA